MKTKLLAFGLLLLLAQVVSAQTLGTTNLLEGATAGADSVVLAANGTWTATANSPWLHLSAANQSGSVSTNVIFTFDANPGATRTGTLAIAGRTLTVTQAGSTYVAAGAVTTLVSGLGQAIGVAVDGAGNVYIADENSDVIKKWTVANNTVTTLASVSPGDYLDAVAVDGAGNVYMAVGYKALAWEGGIYEWSAADSSVTTRYKLVNWMKEGPFTGVAVDGLGNVYYADLGGSAVYKLSVADSNRTTLVSAIDPTGVAVDVAGNVYYSCGYWVGAPINKWTAANSNVTTLVSGMDYPSGVAVDGSGNVYICDGINNVLYEWMAASSTVTTVFSAPPHPYPYQGVAVDGAGNVYIADGDGAIDELPHAFVDPTAKTEAYTAGTDALPVVLPATANLTGPFAPVSDSAWLTITGSANGIVSFAFTANKAPTNRTANITMLGQAISVTQAAAPPAPNLTPCQPSGWSDKLVVSSTAGATADSAIYFNDEPLYVNFCVANVGTAPTGTGFNCVLSVDGTLNYTGSSSILTNGGNVTWLNRTIGPLSAGTHSLQVSADSGNVITESDESDNTYTKTIVVVAPTNHFEWSGISSPQIANNAFTVTLNALTSANTPATNFTGTVTFSGVASNGATLFSDDFEDGINDWTTESGSYSRTVDTIGANGTSRSFSLNGGNNTAYDGLSHSLANITPDQVSFYVRASTTTAAGAGFFTLGAAKSRSGSVAQFALQANGQMGLYNGVNAYLTTYQASQWYKILLQFNWPNHTIDFYVDGTLVAGAVPFCSSSVNSLAILSLYNLASTQVWYDQILMIQEGVSQSIIIHPAVSGNFNNGVWTGTLSAQQPATNLVLTASDGAGHAGSSQAITVIAPTTNCLLTVLASPLNSGSVSGGGAYPAGSQQQITATPNSGWQFAHWQDGLTTNPRTVTVPVGGAPYTATFTQPWPAISVTPASQSFGSVLVGTSVDLTFYVTNAGGGTLTGAASVTPPFAIVSGGSYGLPAGQGQPVVVRYSPTAAGTTNATVTFTGGGGTTVAVAGTAALTVLPSGTPVLSNPVRLSSGQFQFNLSGAVGSNYVVSYSTDLKTWKTLNFFTMTNTCVTNLDRSVGASQRFYRVTLSP